MSKSILLVLLLCVIGYLAYDRFTAPSVPAEPTPTPTPTPFVRLAPEGILYVVEEFSVPIDGGIHGFPPGKMVRIISRDGNQVTVADGDVQATAGENSFTDNLDVVERINSRNVSLATASSNPPVASADSDPSAEAGPEQTPSETDKRIQALDRRRSDLAYRLNRLKIEISSFPGETSNAGIKAPRSMHEEERKLEYQLQVLDLDLQTLRGY